MAGPLSIAVVDANGAIQNIATMDALIEAGHASKVFSIAGTSLVRPLNVTPYSPSDSISDNGTAGSVSAYSMSVADEVDMPISITEIEIDTNDTGLANGGVIDVYVFNSDPTANSGVGGGDNQAYSQKRAGFRARFRGTFLKFSDGGKAICRPVDGDNVPLAIEPMLPATGTRNIFLQFVAVTAFTPSANGTTLTPRVKGYQDRS